MDDLEYYKHKTGMSDEEMRLLAEEAAKSYPAAMEFRDAILRMSKPAPDATQVSQVGSALQDVLAERARQDEYEKAIAERDGLIQERAKLQAEIERLRAALEEAQMARVGELQQILDAIATDDGAVLAVIEGFRRYLIRNAPALTCSYCGLMIDNSDPDAAVEQMMDHITQCKLNPLVAIIHRLSEQHERLRAALHEIQVNAYEDIRNGLADDTSLFQIEADARAALKGGER